MLEGNPLVIGLTFLCPHVVGVSDDGHIPAYGLQAAYALMHPFCFLLIAMHFKWPLAVRSFRSVRAVRSDMPNLVETS